MNASLMAPATARLTGRGKSFVSRAEKILDLANLSNRTSINVSVGWFQSFIAIAENGSYVDAARILGWKRFKVMRGVSELENWLGTQVVFSGDGINLTVAGEKVLPVAREIVQILEDFFDPNFEWRRGKTKPRQVPWWMRTYDTKGPTWTNRKR